MRAPYESLFDRLCTYVRIEGWCWTWTGPVRRHGGGDRPALTVRRAGEKHPVTGRQANPAKRNAARLMCELIHGPAPGPEYEASHLCNDNWLCICPDHLIWETKRENMARMWKRRREEAELDLSIPAPKYETMEAPF